MGVEHADPAEPLFQRQRLALELDPVLAEDLRPNVGLGRPLYVGVPVLEDDLGVPDWKAVLIRDAPPQNEGIVVQPEVVGVDEENLTDLERRGVKALR